MKILLFISALFLGLDAFADFAFNTPVVTLRGSVAIQNMAVGSKFIGAEFKDGQVIQSEKTVMYSSGTGPYLNIQMMRIELGNEKILIVNPDHVFVLSNKKLILAEQLNITDELLGADGSPVKILSVSMGLMKSGQHHIAASTNFQEEDLDFVISQGVLSGDFMVQIFFHTLSDDLKEIR